MRLAISETLTDLTTDLVVTNNNNLGPGSEAPWLHWKCLNKLRIAMGRCKSNRLKWKYSDADTIYDCGEQTQTMDHLLKCPMLSQECTTEDLMEYNESAKECIFQWMNNVTRQENNLRYSVATMFLCRSPLIRNINNNNHHHYIYLYIYIYIYI